MDANEIHLRGEYDRLGDRQNEIHTHIAMLNRELAEIGSKRVALIEEIGMIVMRAETDG